MWVEICLLVEYKKVQILFVVMKLFTYFSCLLAAIHSWTIQQKLKDFQTKRRCQNKTFWKLYQFGSTWCNKLKQKVERFFPFLPRRKCHQADSLNAKCKKVAGMGCKNSNMEKWNFIAVLRGVTDCFKFIISLHQHVGLLWE